MAELVEWKWEIAVELMELTPRVVAGFAMDKRRKVVSEVEQESSELLEERTVAKLDEEMAAKGGQAATTTLEEVEVASSKHPKQRKAAVGDDFVSLSDRCRLGQGPWRNSLEVQVLYL